MKMTQIIWRIDETGIIERNPCGLSVKNSINGKLDIFVFYLF